MTWTWSFDWLLRFSVPKCEVMHIGRFTSDEYSYFMNGQPLPTVNVEKDLGVYVDNQLKFHHHTAAVIARANYILPIVNNSFVNLDTSMFPMLYKTLVRSILKYANATLLHHLPMRY